MNALIKVAILTLNLFVYLNLNAAYLTDVPVFFAKKRLG